MASDYTEGYHVLMEWMSKSFEQKEVLRVVKALAAFRPSLIALQCVSNLFSCAHRTAWRGLIPYANGWARLCGGGRGDNDPADGLGCR